MKTKSIWEETKTFFPLLISYLESHPAKSKSVCIVGASDGKFVTPFAQKGWNVTAIESDDVALHGGFVEFPKLGKRKIPGLEERLRIEGLREHVQIVNADFLTCQTPDVCSVIFTSCSWHYSRNHHRPVQEFIEKMQATVGSGGIFCAEYMMPSKTYHENKEHYLDEGEIRKYFIGEWEILEEFYTPPFIEEAHVGNPTDHTHRMGFFMAKKRNRRPLS